jgi:hypothetical protein
VDQHKFEGHVKIANDEVFLENYAIDNANDNQHNDKGGHHTGIISVPLVSHLL